MTQCRFRFRALLPLFLLSTQVVLADPPTTRPSPATSEKTLSTIDLTLNVLDSRGQIHALQPDVDNTASVFVFMTGECPISKSYMPTLSRLANDWKTAGQPVRFFAVWGDATQNAAQVAKFAREHDLSFPILIDRDGELARRFQPTHVPEAFVLNASAQIVYRGSIDDRYKEIGRRRPQATAHFLAEAVTQTLQATPVAVAYREPVGCLFESPGQAVASSTQVTYTRDIAPILFANCVVCHRAGEVGPFPLGSYEDAAKRAGQIALVVERRLMPPWMPAERHGELIGQRRLSDRQVDLIKKWAENGKPEGDSADLPPLPEFTTGWRLGEPDLVLEMPEAFSIPADGPDIFQNFVIPIDIPEDKVVATVDFQPGSPEVVHHSILFLDRNHVARVLDAASPEPGYSSFGGPGILPTGAIGGWSPGRTPRRLPDNMGRHLKQGSDLVMQIHYHPNGKAQTDRSKVGVYFVDKPKNVVAGIWVANYQMDIPPGEADYRRSTSYTLPSDILLVGIIPHMHLIGRSMKAVATFPDGTQKQLIDVPDWNFYWQDEYYYAQPLKLPKGTRIDVDAVYDNSTANLSNPNDPPRRITWGEQTTDEMFFCFFLVAADSPRELVGVIMKNLLHDALQPRGRAARRNANKE